MHTETASPVGWVSAAKMAPKATGIPSARNPTLLGRPKLLGYAPRGANPTYARDRRRGGAQ